MKRGSKFGEVSKIQELLNKEGINVGLADGLFGPITDAGVKTFQTKKNLDSDGVIGPMTRAALNEICF